MYWVLGHSYIVLALAGTEQTHRLRHDGNWSENTQSTHQPHILDVTIFLYRVKQKHLEHTFEDRPEHRENMSVCHFVAHYCLSLTLKSTRILLVILCGHLPLWVKPFTSGARTLDDAGSVELWEVRKEKSDHQKIKQKQKIHIWLWSCTLSVLLWAQKAL